jgi:hypothetical protein
MTLRIQRLIENDLVVFKLTGRVQAGDVPELLELLRTDSLGCGVLLDMTDVRLVDRESVHFLAQSEAGGAELRNCSAYIREWIAQEKNAMSRKQIEDPTGFAG